MLRAGFTRPLGSGVELIVDGGVRRKFQQSQFFNYFNNPFFVFDPSTAGPANYVNTVMTTSSVTPRLDVRHQLSACRNRLLTGIDVYNTQYDLRPAAGRGIAGYSSLQYPANDAASIYAMNTTTVTPALEISYGGRLQRNLVKGQDVYNAAADPNAGFYASNPQAAPADSSEWQYVFASRLRVPS